MGGGRPRCRGEGKNPAAREPGRHPFKERTSGSGGQEANSQFDSASLAKLEPTHVVCYSHEVPPTVRRLHAGASPFALFVLGRNVLAGGAIPEWRCRILLRSIPSDRGHPS